jgi:tetraprenyl-beta-curcumene synthase
MRTVIHAINGSAPAARTKSVVVLTRQSRRPAGAAELLRLGHVFTEIVARYLLRVLPVVHSELGYWRARVADIPDPILRGHAWASLLKQGNIEGAALFATLAPPAQRPATVRALVAYQSAYNYLDTLSEQPSGDPVNNADQLDQALLVALGRGGFGSPHVDYYQHNPQRSDGGYLRELVDSCRNALAGLPSFAAVAPRARAAAGRIVDFQALNLSNPHRGHDPLQSWAVEATPPGSAVAWWETAASAGSSLAVHALIAAAADPRLHPEDALRIEGVYWPWIGALHSLLDSLVDHREDAELGQRSLLGYYPTPANAAIGLSSLAMRAQGALECLPNRHEHQVIMTAMCSYYLSAPECYTARAQTIAHALTGILGTPLSVALVMFRARRLAATMTLGSYT